MRFLVAAMSTLLLTVKITSAEQYFRSGTTCVKRISEQDFGYDARGIYNYDVTSGTLLCPISYYGFSNPFDTSSFVDVDYRDLNSNTAAGELYCVHVGTDVNGNVFVGATKYSCASPGGCTYADPGFTSGFGVRSFLRLQMVDNFFGDLGSAIRCRLPHGQGSPDSFGSSSITGWAVADF